MCHQFSQTLKSRKEPGCFSAKALRTSIRHKELIYSSYFWEQERADFVSEVWQRAKSCNQFHFLINERSTGKSQPEALGTAECSDMTERLLEGARLSLCLSPPSRAAPADRRCCQTALRAQAAAQPLQPHGRAPRKHTSPSIRLTSGSRNSENTWPCKTGIGMGLVIVCIVYMLQSQVLGVTRYSGAEDLSPTLPTGKSQIQNDKSFIIG